MAIPIEFSSGTSPIEMWCSRPLPWMNKTDDEKRAVVTLRERLKALEDDSESVLTCQFHSEASARFDIENVLSYNVGLSAFDGPAACRGLIFERVRKSPRLSPSGASLQHCHWYGLTRCPTTPPAGPRMQFSVSSTKHVDLVWWAMANAPPIDAGEISDRFELYVEFGLPGRSALRSVLKPLVDGIVAGLQFDPDPRQKVIERLAARMGMEAQSVSRRLKNPNNPLLGERSRLVHKRGNSVQWNPGDDKCDRVTVIARGQPGTCTVVASPLP
jgi:hypothetical protein